MLFLAPPPSAHTLHTSCIGQSSSPNHLRKLSVSNTHSFFLSMFQSLSLSTTQPLFPLLLPNVFTSHTRHCTPCRALSLSPSPSHPLALNTCIAYLAPNLSCARTHVVYLGHSLETVSLFLPHGGPHSLNLALFI